MNIKLSLYVLAAGALAGTALVDISPANAGNAFKGNCSNGGFHRPNYHGKKGPDPAPTYQPQTEQPKQIVHASTPQNPAPTYQPQTEQPKQIVHASKSEHGNHSRGNGSNHSPKVEMPEAHKSNSYPDRKVTSTPNPKSEKYWTGNGSNKNPNPSKSDYNKSEPKKEYTPVVTTPPSKYPSNNCWKGNGSNHNPKPSMPQGHGGSKPAPTYCYAG